ERLADLRGDQADLRQRHRLLPLAEALHELPQVAPGDVLHGDVEALLVLAELQHLDDVRVRELDRDARLVHEHADELGVLAHGGKDLLDRQQPLESLHAEGLGDEHFRHATDGDPIEEEVFPELGGMAHGEGGPRRQGRGRAGQGAVGAGRAVQEVRRRLCSVQRLCAVEYGPRALDMTRSGPNLLSAADKPMESWARRAPPTTCWWSTTSRSG